MLPSNHTLSHWSRVVAGIGFLLLLAAFVLRLRMLFSGTAVIAEGEPFRGELEAYTPSSLVYDEGLGLPEVAFYPTKLDAKQGEQGELRAITAQVRVPDAGGEERFFGDMFRLQLPEASVRIWRINVAPVLAVRGPGGDETVLVPKRKLWRKDQLEERLRLPDDSGFLNLRLFPDFRMGPDGVPSTASMALRDPVLQVRLLPDRAEAPRGLALLRPGDSRRFGSHEVELVELRHWGAVEVFGRHRNRVAYAGVLLLGLGLAGQLVAWIRRRRSP